MGTLDSALRQQPAFPAATPKASGVANFGVRLRSFIWLMACGLSLSSTNPTHAIQINLQWDGGTAPFDANGAKLKPIVEAAATIWEGIFQDAATVTITYRYQSGFAPGVLANATANNLSGGRPTTGVLNVSNSPQTWFFDSTPTGNSEFNVEQTHYGDLSAADKAAWFNNSPPNLLEVGYDGEARETAPSEARNGYDMLSIVLHELGHILGLSHPSMAKPEVHNDPGFDFDVPAVLGVGNAFGILAAGQDPDDVNEWGHVASGPSLMFPSATPGWRTLPSASDVFAIASAANWSTTAINLPRKEFLGGAWHAAGNWIGNQVPSSANIAFIQHGGTATLVTAGAAGNLLIENSVLTITGNLTFQTLVQLRGSGRLRIESASALNSASGYLEVLGASSTGDHTGRLELAGGHSFNSVPLHLRGRDTNADPHLRNVSGNNTWNGPITLWAAAGNYTVESAAGTLTLSSTATIAPGNATGSRTIYLQGAGNGVANGAISDGGSDTTYHIKKTGAGTWTLGANNTYAGDTEVLEGELHLSGANASITNSALIDIHAGAALRRIGGHFIHSQFLYIDVDGEASVAPGFWFENKSSVVNDGMIVTDEFRNRGWLSGAGKVTGDVLNAEGGVIAPGLGIATTTIVGAFTQTAGTLDIQLGDTGADFLNVEGLATLGGGLQLSLLDEFQPNSLTAFTILEASMGSTIAGAFANVAAGERLVTTDGAGSFRVNYGATSLYDANLIVLDDFRLDNHPQLGDADFDGNGTVSGSDLSIWRDQFGRVDVPPKDPLHPNGDADIDGDVDGNDFLVWQTQVAASSTPSSTAVPEPSCAVIAAFALGGLGRRARRSSRSDTLSRRPA